MLAILLLSACGAEPPQFQVENKTAPVFIVQNKVAPKCAVCGPICPCPAGACAAGQCPAPKGSVAPAVGSGGYTTVCGPDGCRIVRVNQASGAQIAPAYSGGYYSAPYLGDGQGWWLGKALGRARPR